MHSVQVILVRVLECELCVAFGARELIGDAWGDGLGTVVFESELLEWCFIANCFRTFQHISDFQVHLKVTSLCNRIRYISWLYKANV